MTCSFLIDSCAHNNHLDNSQIQINGVNYSQRQVQSAFLTSTNHETQPTLVASDEQQVAEQNIGGIVLSSAIDTCMNTLPMGYNQQIIELQEKTNNANEHVLDNQNYYTNPLSDILTSGSFCVNRSSILTIENNFSTSTDNNLNEAVSVTGNTDIKTTSLIYNLKEKYKYNYFLSKLSCTFESNEVRFGAPKGICTLNNDRLLVGNFSYNTILLLDIKGTVHHIFKYIISPKDVFVSPSNPSQAVAATRKEIIRLDLNTGQVAAKSNLEGFYPWNLHYSEEREVIAACDPAGERIVYFDKNLASIGELSFRNSFQQSSATEKNYPYAVHFLPNDKLLSLTCTKGRFELEKFDIAQHTKINWLSLPSNLKSYSIYNYESNQFLIPDSANHRLFSIDNDSINGQYEYESGHEPYAITSLSTGTLCITDLCKLFGTNGGISIISEIDLQSNQ